MLMQKVMVSALVAAGMIGGAALSPSSDAQDVIIITVPPPAPQTEPVPPSRTGYVWSPGHYDWQNNKHVWVSGKWVAARTGAVYQPNRWVEKDGRWNLERERWREN